MPIGAHLEKYLKDRPLEKAHSEAVAFYASLDSVAKVNPLIADSILKELEDQRSNLKLIASENYSSLAVQLAMGNLMTDKYAEGVSGSRFYAGCENVDRIETEAVKLAMELFGAEHAYVQPHSGADANMVAFTAILAAKVHRGFLDEVTAMLGKKNKHGEMAEIAPKDIRGLVEEDWKKLRQKTLNQKMMALDIGSGGHLTHGYRMNISSWIFDTYQYSVSKETGLLDYDEIEKMAREVKPLILLAGFSAYPRRIDFERMRKIADQVGAVLMVDMAHFAGLVAGKVFQGKYDPVPYADIVTSTTHKTLRGPRGGIVLCKKWLADFVDKGCPTMLGGPLPQMMAAKAVAFRQALQPEFREYAKRIVENSQALADECMILGMKVLTNGTDNHLLQINVFESFGLTGRQAEEALRECGLTLNRNAIPFDPKGVWYTSGLRLGTPALTALGMGPKEMKEIAGMIHGVLSATRALPGADGKPTLSKYFLEKNIKTSIKNEVKMMLEKFRLYPELD
jgi:glycine hydroxymethyltransferase